MIVTSGSKALRRMWRRVIVDDIKPFASAVRTYPRDDVEHRGASDPGDDRQRDRGQRDAGQDEVLDRVPRRGEITRDDAVQHVEPGRMVDTDIRWSDRPVGGSQPSLIAKTYRRRNPRKNTGIVIPIREPTTAVESSHDPKRRAAKYPSGTPMPMAITKASAVSSMVAGNSRTISSVTGRRVCAETPKSPVIERLRYFQYCTMIGWSRP